MAEERSKKPKRRVRPAPTVREKASRPANDAQKPRRIRRTAGTIARPLRAAHHAGKKEFYLPLPDSRVGRFLNKRRSIIPRYFREAWQELKQVTWPNRKQTAQLTLAVFVFAIIFGILVAVTDYGLDKVFKQILL